MSRQIREALLLIRSRDHQHSATPCFSSPKLTSSYRQKAPLDSLRPQRNAADTFRFTLCLFQDLMEHLEKQDRTIRKLKKQLKVYSKRIGEMGGEQGRRLRVCFSLI